MDSDLDDVRFRPSARAWNRVGATGIACAVAALLLTTIARAAEAPTASALQAAITNQHPPALTWQGDTGITIEVVISIDSRRISGRCHAGRRVVIQDGTSTSTADCHDGRYTARMPAGADEGLVATQVLLNGNIAATRVDKLRTSPAGQRIPPAELGKALASARPGDRIAVEAGTYADTTINLSESRGSADRPVIIDGNNAVAFTGATRIQIGAGHVVLRGFTFRDVGIGAITITGPAVRITESNFSNCGDPQKPQAECVIVRAGGKNAELDFNTFTGSRSMSINVHAGNDGEQGQPVNAFIHHNVFRDIPKLSDNGQEPIQIAGPNGGGSNAELKARIEHNLFYRAEGDRDAVSIKTPGTTLRWNVFRDMDAAPNIRGGRNAVVTDNLLIRTQAIRINGSDHRVEGNVVLCPSAGIGLVVSHGSPGYETAANTLIRGNIIATKGAGILFGAQTQPLESVAHGNKVVSNAFHLPENRPMYEIRPADMASKIKQDNSFTASRSGPELCS
ncbi:MAG: hypothetical protein GEU95_15030 [Rhizobiales bacterium]|nr:hypothetical protein [Hyphomicrobiales bacterium]